MYNFDANSIPALTENTRAAIAAADDALLTNTQMLSTILESVKASDLPINVTQDLYGSMLEGANKLLEGRKQLQKSVATMRAIAKHSPHHERMYGCPTDPMGLAGTEATKSRLRAV
ncbi:MAG: hypothetical protein ABR601_07255 [Parasphingopyxis sp.]|nr:hypothetical protein [Sphingomonadales bacterium]